jgi:hypothetical protein
MSNHSGPAIVRNDLQRGLVVGGRADHTLAGSRQMASSLGHPSTASTGRR